MTLVEFLVVSSMAVVLPVAGEGRIRGEMRAVPASDRSAGRRRGARPGAILWSLGLAATLAGAPAAAQESWWERLKSHAANGLDQSRLAWSEGKWELYVTGRTWHAPWAYDQENLDSHNNAAWGGGLGRSVVDPSGNRHSLYTMAFSDSHSKPMYMAGYNWQTYWGSDGSGLKYGLGYTVFLAARSDISHYLPLPGILPTASLQYEKIELMMSYVPSLGRNNGNVAFFFARYHFE